MSVAGSAIRQPVTVAVGVLLILLAGFISLGRIPIQLTPNVEDTIISVTTRWEGASPEEIEQEIIDAQEDKLQGLAYLQTMTSKSQQGSGTIRLEFAVGTRKEDALREVSDKLREVPDYPENADEPVIEASDPENRDYIAWIVFDTTDPHLDIRTLRDFADDRLKPILERVPGMAEVNVLGGREREAQIRYDPVTLAQRGITLRELVTAIQRTNRNVSAGDLSDSKSNVRVRTLSQYHDVHQVESTVIRYTSAGPVFVRDVAAVTETFKEPRDFVRSKGKGVIAINAQKEIGANIMQVMAALQHAIATLNAPGGLLDSEASRRGLHGKLVLTQVYDQTVYIDDALALVKNNMWLGGTLAISVLLIFLRSLRSAGIIALAIPISVIGAVVAMVAMGRSINVISLAGMAFAVGMVVDNAIVVLENIHRHLEMGKPALVAARDGTQEVWGAILAATLTTIVVFIPVLLIEEEAGQLFRDIALAICAAVGLSLLVSVTVIPTTAARLLSRRPTPPSGTPGRETVRTPWRWGRVVLPRPGELPRAVGASVYRLSGSTLARWGIVLGLTAASIVGTLTLLPPADYLPTGNRNLVFGLVIPPAAYNLDHRAKLAGRIEDRVRLYWEVGDLDAAHPNYADARRALPAVPTFNWATQSPGDPVVPPPLENYFIVSFRDMMFHGGVSADPQKAVDLMPLFQHATSTDVAPGVLSYAFQVPLFRLGGSSGSAIKVNFSGADLDRVGQGALHAFLELHKRFPQYTIKPDPTNFDVPGPELQVIPRRVKLANVGLTPEDLGLAVETNGDGAIIGEYRIGGETIDLKLITKAAVIQTDLQGFQDAPIATPSGNVVPLSSVAWLKRIASAPEINRVSRQRSVTLEVTPPEGLALEAAIASVAGLLESERQAGHLTRDVEVGFTGSASKLASVRKAMLGDGTVAGTLSSSLVLALIVVYLLMCILFQSFLRPIVIMFSVPLATVGGFAGLFVVYRASLANAYLPVQKFDVLTMLGFVILIGVVVNNAILIVHQSLNFMQKERGEPRRAIADAVETRVRPIFMSTLTSIGGMAPLVLMPGSGSELYRGLGSVVIGGLLVATVFTLFLVPLLLSVVTDLQQRFGLLPPPLPNSAGTPPRPHARDRVRSESNRPPVPVSERSHEEPKLKRAESP